MIIQREQTVVNNSTIIAQIEHVEDSPLGEYWGIVKTDADGYYGSETYQDNSLGAVIAWLDQTFQQVIDYEKDLYR